MGNALAILLVTALQAAPAPEGELPAERPAVSAPSLERKIHEQVNAARTERGLAPLARDDALDDIARVHSEEMATTGVLSHVNQRGQGPMERGFEAGYRCRKDYGQRYTIGVSENLSQQNLYDSVRRVLEDGQVVGEIYDWNTEEDIARSTVQGWLASEEHRQNLLEPRFDREGIGVAITADGRVYITQNLC